MEKKRNSYKGEVRDKEKTMQRLLEAVGSIILNVGYQGLGVNKVAKKAGVNKELIYRYFDTFENLVETYVKQKDFWIKFRESISKDIDISIDDNGEHLSMSILENQLNYFYESIEMQNMVIWEISENSKMMRDITEMREALGAEFFKITDSQFDGTTLDIRAVQAIQVAGIYHLVLHARNNGSTFCGIDINEREGRNKIIKALKDVISLVYKEARMQKQSF